MIDGGDHEPWHTVVPQSPASHEQHKRHAVGTAGNGKDQEAKFGERLEERIELVVLNRRIVGSGG